MAELRFGNVTELNADGARVRVKVWFNNGTPPTTLIPVLAGAAALSVGDQVAVVINTDGTGDGIVLGKY